MVRSRYAVCRLDPGPEFRQGPPAESQGDRKKSEIMRRSRKVETFMSRKTGACAIVVIGAVGCDPTSNPNYGLGGGGAAGGHVTTTGGTGGGGETGADAGAGQGGGGGLGGAGGGGGAAGMDGGVN